MTPTPSRQLFLDGCQDIAAQLAGEGFRYRRSIPDLRMRIEEWRCEIRFQSSRYNSVEDIDIGLHVGLFSERIAAYRNTDPGRSNLSAHVTGGYLEYWNPYSMPTPRNLSEPHRASTIATMVSRIRTGPLLALTCLRNPVAFLDTVGDLILVHAEPHTWVEYLAAYGQHTQIPVFFRRVEAGLRWNDGTLRDQRRILVDAQRKIAGLAPVTDYNPAAADALIASLQRAGRLADLEGLVLN